MFLTMASARLPCCTTLSRLPRSMSVSSSICLRVLSSTASVLHGVLQLVDQLAGDGREIVDEIERVLDLVRDAGGELAERGELLRLHQAVLRGAQILQRLRQFARAGLHAFEQAHILDCNCGLVSERRCQLDLFIGERAHFRARQAQHAGWDTLAQHWDGENRAVIAQSLSLHQGILRISLYVGDMHRTPFEQRTPEPRAAFGLDRNISDIIHEFARKAVCFGAVEHSFFLAGNNGLVGIAEPGS